MCPGAECKSEEPIAAAAYEIACFGYDRRVARAALPAVALFFLCLSSLRAATTAVAAAAVIVVAVIAAAAAAVTV